MVNIQQDWLDDETHAEQICVYMHAGWKGCEG